MMFAAPAVGYVAGSWADRHFDSEPYLMITGVIFGFIAAGVQTARLINKASALEKETDNENEKHS